MKSVYLSPSLQEWNKGVDGYGTEEYRMNLIVDKMVEYLKDYELKVYRNKPEWSLGYTILDSNQKNVDLHFAIHSNAFNGEWRGAEVFCYRKGGEGERFANLVYKEISKLTPVKDRGVKEGYNFYGPGKHMAEVQQTTAPASLVEIAFHDNLQDVEWIKTHQNEIAIGLANAVLKYFNIKIKSSKLLEQLTEITTLLKDIHIRVNEIYKQLEK